MRVADPDVDSYDGCASISDDDADGSTDGRRSRRIGNAASNKAAFRVLFEAQSRRALGMPLPPALHDAERPGTRAATLREAFTAIAENLLASPSWPPGLRAALRERLYIAVYRIDGAGDTYCTLCGTTHRSTSTAHHQLWLCPTSRLADGSCWVSGRKCAARAVYYHSFVHLWAHMRMQAAEALATLSTGATAVSDEQRDAMLTAIMFPGGMCDQAYARVVLLSDESMALAGRRVARALE
jgi:hypothetical protein